MKTAVKKTSNGNYAIILDEKLMMASEDSIFEEMNNLKWFQIPVKTRVIEFNNTLEIVTNYKLSVQKEEEQLAKEIAIFNSSKEVKRLDYNGVKVQLRSTGKLHNYIVGWNRTALNETSKTAILARYFNNEPLDKSNLSKEVLDKIKAKENLYLENLKIEQKRLEESARSYQELISKPLEPTVENLRIVMENLNTQNWGSWTLPKFTCGYSANQYDCDGVTATTIKLHILISDEDSGIENENMFSFGAPRGHLNKYQSLT